MEVATLGTRTLLEAVNLPDLLARTRALKFQLSSFTGLVIYAFIYFVRV
jgi:hypothetical protein